MLWTIYFKMLWTNCLCCEQIAFDMNYICWCCDHFVIDVSCSIMLWTIGSCCKCFVDAVSVESHCTSQHFRSSHSRKILINCIFLIHKSQHANNANHGVPKYSPPPPNLANLQPWVHSGQWRSQLDASGHAISQPAPRVGVRCTWGGGPGELPWKILKSKLPESPFAAIWAWKLRKYLDLMKGKMWIFMHISDDKIDRKIRKPHSQTPADIDGIIIRIAMYSKIIRGFSAWSNFMSIFISISLEKYISIKFSTILLPLTYYILL